LRNDGHHVTAAADGEEAIDLVARDVRPDAVVD
jgi:CheY-like chemotaxis protein